MSFYNPDRIRSTRSASSGVTEPTANFNLDTSDNEAMINVEVDMDSACKLFIFKYVGTKYW